VTFRAGPREYLHPPFSICKSPFFFPPSFFVVIAEVAMASFSLPLRGFPRAPSVLLPYERVIPAPPLSFPFFFDHAASPFSPAFVDPFLAPAKLVTFLTMTWVSLFIRMNDLHSEAEAPPLVKYSLSSLSLAFPLFLSRHHGLPCRGLPLLLSRLDAGDLQRFVAPARLEIISIGLFLLSLPCEPRY